MNSPDVKLVKHLRQILLWPIYLAPLEDGSSTHGHWELFEKAGPENPWHVVDDEFGAPEEFQQRHYNEFVSFLPPVQRFLYGQGIGRSVRQSYGESPIRVLRREDVAKVRLLLERDKAPIELSIAHIDLYFFFDVDVALLAVEVYADDIPFDVAEDALFRFGRAYPAYWEEGGRGGHCAERVEWLDASGGVLAISDYERREKFLSFVCQHRAPAVASHWEFLLSPLVLYHGDRKGSLRFKQLEYYRMPYMAFLAMERPDALAQADMMRLAVGAAPRDGVANPYSDSVLADFERRNCFDRDYLGGKGSGEFGVRFLGSGHNLVAVGDAADAFFVDRDAGMLGRFRHQHFLVFLIAHFQKAALRMFSDRLVAAVSRLDITDVEANRVFRREIRGALENFLRFAHRYWFHEISNHVQVRGLFDLTRRHLGLDELYSEVREELQDMSEFLDVDAMRRQNDTVVRLTVVTTFGLIGTVTTGFLGMNLLGWADEPLGWRALAFLAVLLPVMILTLYTVMKSKSLSEFLDLLSDDTASYRDRWRAFWRVWRW